MSTYSAPIKDQQFILHEVLRLSQSNIPGYSDHDRAFTEAVLNESGKLAHAVIAPLNAVGDREGCRWEAGTVHTPGGFKDAFEKLKSGGWPGIDMPEQYGGQSMPAVMGSAVTEHLMAANQAFSMYHGLTHGLSLIHI